jgi:hypothetical protein
MARIINGLIKGKLGNRIYRIKNGRQFVSAVPDFSNRILSDKTKKGIECFSMTGSLNSAVLKTPVFKEHWDGLKMNFKGNSISKMMKVNYSILKIKEDVSFLKLVNSYDLHPVRLEGFTFSPLEISANFLTDKKAGISTQASLQGVIYLMNPTDPFMRQYQFIPFSTKNMEYVPGEVFSLRALLPSASSEIIKNYGSWKVIMNLAFKVEQGSVVCFSETVVQ